VKVYVLNEYHLSDYTDSLLSALTYYYYYYYYLLEVQYYRGTTIGGTKFSSYRVPKGSTECYRGPVGK
jgi:hypothetical protein